MKSVKKVKAEIERAISGFQSEKGLKREKHFKTLLSISEKTPEILYPKWDLFVDFLRKEEVFNKFFAIHLIENLVCVDTEKKFEAIFDEYYDLLSHESPVVAPHIAESSGKIVKAKPHLESKITEILLNVDKISRCRHEGLLKSYVIDAFDRYFEKVGQKKKVINFVKKQINSESPKTRKTAEEFLKKWGE